MTPLERILIERIRRSGPMPFAAFMSQALYHPRYGYYASGVPRTGWSGDYVTSPELDRGFGELWGLGFEEVWRRCGAPSEFHLVEVGPGEGSFAEAVLSSVGGGFAEALSYRLVERFPAAEGRQRERLSRWRRVAWSASITEVPPIAAGCVFANEVLDNLPVHLMRKESGRLVEVCVDVEGSALGFTTRAPSTPHLQAFLARLGIEPSEGDVFEVGLAAESFVGRCAALLGRGALVLVDYGASAPDLAEKREGSLLSYSGAGVDEAVLDRPGEKDITCHVNWTSVRGACDAAGLEATGPLPQRDVLRALGLGELDRELRRRYDDATARRAGAEAFAALSRRQALAALADPGGLGSLGVLTAARGTGALGFMSRGAQRPRAEAD